MENRQMYLQDSFWKEKAPKWRPGLQPHEGLGALWLALAPVHRTTTRVEMVFLETGVTLRDRGR